jgi:hypothetical protein
VLRSIRGALVVVTAVCLTGCTAAKELAAVRQVQFHLNGVSGARLAGVSLDRLQSPSDLSAADVAGLTLAIASGEVPLQMTVHVEGRNPETNTVTARLLAMDWDFLVDDRELVSGRLEEPYTFEPGRARDVPIPVRCDLVPLFGKRSADLVDAALAIAGRGSSSHRAAVRLIPTVDTALGRIRYPAPITLEIRAPESR